MSYKVLSKLLFSSLNDLFFFFLFSFLYSSKIDFILTSCCSSSLESLYTCTYTHTHIYIYTHDSNVVTLPENISRFVRLHSRSIENCNELWEIPKLPQSMVALGLFSWGSIKNINYTKFKIKENLNILTLQKIKIKINTKTQIHKVSYFKIIA